jgi:TetR/AcrR family transcriptional repressor of mexJK operon
MSQLSAALSSEDISPKRRQILAAAEALFLSQGYGAVSMDAVARLAGVSKATLYAHFTSKDALFATIVADKGSQTPIEPGLFPDHVEDLHAALTAIGQRVVRFMLLPRTLAIFRVTIAESGRFPELGRAFWENGPELFADTFCAWISSPAVRVHLHAPDPLTATHHFMSLMRSTLFLRATLGLAGDPTEAEIDTTVEDAVGAWLRAYGAERNPLPQEEGA